MVNQHLEDGVFTAKEPQIESAKALLPGPKRWTKALKPLRLAA
jgi:hypothetical protein